MLFCGCIFDISNKQKLRAMKLSIEQIEKSILNNTNQSWDIYVICPQKGAIIVVNNAFITPVTTYRKVDGLYKKDKEMAYSAELKAALTTMIDAHNNSDETQKEAEQFDLYA